MTLNVWNFLTRQESLTLGTRPMMTCTPSVTLASFHLHKLDSGSGRVSSAGSMSDPCSSGRQSSNKKLSEKNMGLVQFHVGYGTCLLPEASGPRRQSLVVSRENSADRVVIL